MISTRRSVRTASLCLALAVGVRGATAQQPAPPATPVGPQWLNADPARKTNQSNFRALERVADAQ